MCLLGTWKFSRAFGGKPCTHLHAPPPPAQELGARSGPGYGAGMNLVRFFLDRATDAKRSQVLDANPTATPIRLHGWTKPLQRFKQEQLQRFVLYGFPRALAKNLTLE